ncbi:hypothetical protein Harman_25500 [Haloarcula mannanilytica]|uniref:Uncharacterized protein n=1 Tax=Haloarcula mannanilytica TaxID=2509225 RepID=A0A4C2EJP9_9EURY|nr:hypothetical protein [Haloarcula mannanilytica]GCF14615.1 hypothetical protein Harman_25500 [Haloarcula mannanilytica]
MISSEHMDDSEIKIEDSFFAPWGLASEELPMHILWEGKPEKIILNYPEELEILNIYNVEGEQFESPPNGKIEIKSQSLITPGYLNIIFKDSNIYENSVEEKDIEVKFLKDSKTKRELIKKTRIIRPQIRVQNAPDKILLTDEDDPKPIEIDMEYVGFGMAQVAVEAEAEGEFVSQGASFLHDLLESMLETEVHKQDVEKLGEPPEDWKNDSDIEVPQEEIEGIVDEMREVVQNGGLGDEYETDEIEEIAEALEEAEQKSTNDSDIAAVIYRFIETALLSSILNVVDRHPTEGVSLSKPTTKVKTEAKAREIEVIVHLKDNLDNEYDETRISIDIDDRRDKGGVYETEIHTNWENYQVDPDEVFTDE